MMIQFAALHFAFVLIGIALASAAHAKRTVRL